MGHDIHPDVICLLVQLPVFCAIVLCVPTVPMAVENLKRLFPIVHAQATRCVAHNNANKWI